MTAALPVVPSKAALTGHKGAAIDRDAEENIPMSNNTAGPREHGVSLGAALRVWARVAALSFGGPAGQIAVMHRIVVDEKR